MKQLMINPEFGMAGDMLAAAFLSAGAPEQDLLTVMKGAAEPLGGADITASRITRGNQTGFILNVGLLNPPSSTEASYLRHHLTGYLDTCGIRTVYARFALRALDYLISAEEQAHKKMDEEKGHHHHHCHLHEAQDIILDICATAWAAQYFQIDLNKVICLTPVHTGGGTIRFSHGLQHVPAPATAALIAEYEIPVAGGPVQSELLTPTGATLLAAFRPHFQTREASPPSIQHTGTGFGTKDFSRTPGKAGGLIIYLQELPANE